MAIPTLTNYLSHVTKVAVFNTVDLLGLYFFLDMPTCQTALYFGFIEVRRYFNSHQLVSINLPLSWTTCLFTPPTTLQVQSFSEILLHSVTQAHRILWAQESAQDIEGGILFSSSWVFLSTKMNETQHDHESLWTCVILRSNAHCQLPGNYVFVPVNSGLISGRERMLYKYEIYHLEIFLFWKTVAFLWILRWSFIHWNIYTSVYPTLQIQGFVVLNPQKHTLAFYIENKREKRT